MWQEESCDETNRGLKEMLERPRGVCGEEGLRVKKRYAKKVLEEGIRGLVRRV